MPILTIAIPAIQYLQFCCQQVQYLGSLNYCICICIWCCMCKFIQILPQHQLNFYLFPYAIFQIFLIWLFLFFLQPHYFICFSNLSIYHLYKYIFMLTLALSVVIFLVIGIVVMALFCLVTRHFNKKLQKALEDQNQIYSMIQEIRGTQQQDVDGQYENYVNNKQNQMMGKDKKKQSLQLQMTEVKQPLKGFGEQANGIGRLKRRLQGMPSGIPLIPLMPQTGRSATSLKSFKPDRLDSLRSNNQTNRSKQGETNPEEAKQTDRSSPTRKPRVDKKRQNIIKHTYTSKIVAYIEQGIFLIQNNLVSVCKKGSIEEKRHLKRSTIKPQQSSFDDALDAYGFEKGTYCAFKYETTLQIPHMKQGEEYPVGSLKGTESKQLIEFAEYYSIKDKLEEDN